jgi:hypothetical protein
MKREKLIRDLSQSKEPSIRWRTRVRILGELPSSARIRRLENEIRNSSRVRRLLSRQHAPYRYGKVRSVYYKWQGVHWVLASLADLGYPAGDPALSPLVNRALDLWLRPAYQRVVRPTKSDGMVGALGVRIIRGRARRCASQQGYALYYATKLGLGGERVKDLASLLLKWQWPDGGWNCDVEPTADTSSFMETLTPMRGLAAYATRTGDANALRGARRASEVFLERGFFRRKSTGTIIKSDFMRLHYPLYWHYDVLGGLKGVVEAGRIHDPRCSAALDWLEAKELPGGVWPAEAQYYRVSPTFQSSSEFVNWGGKDSRRRNDWVTSEALWVLKAADRL